MRAGFRLALRQTQGPIGSVIHLLDLTPAVPDHTTLSSRADTLDIPRLRRSSAGRDAGPVHLLIDNTGLKLCGADAWLLEKHGTKVRRWEGVATSVAEKGRMGWQKAPG